MKVFISASCDMHYGSFYIYGLYQLYGKKNVKFSSQYFKAFKHNNHFLAFIIKENNNIKKVIIDFTDSKLIDESALDWSDVYGKINLDDNVRVHPKIMAIGPSFGIRIYSLYETIWLASSNFLRSYNNIPNKRKFFSDYKAQYKRPQLAHYSYKPSESNFVFFMSSLWKQDIKTNKFRANFIQSCKANKSVDFEGGFAPRTKNDVKGYEELTCLGRIVMQDYLKKTKLSALVFNTPAVKECHGWKLAEYLCLGKAIISTPMERALPKELEDKVHLLFTKGSTDDITEKVNAIISNVVLRQQLEDNAQTYFENHLAPRQVITKLVAF